MDRDDQDLVRDGDQAPVPDEGDSAKGGRGRRKGQGRAVQKPGTAGKGKARENGAPRPRVRPEADPRLSRSMEYGLAILESFSRERQMLGIAEMANIVGISRSTTHRYATTLVVLGYLEQDQKRKYRLARRAAAPGMAAIGALRLRVPAAAVVLDELREETGYTVSMGVLDGARVIYVYRLLGHRPGQHAIDQELGIGAEIPVYSTALGKALLASLPLPERRKRLTSIRLRRRGPNSITEKKKLAAELERIGEEGIAVSDEEMLPGERSIAVLVPATDVEQPLAIDITAPAGDVTVEQLVNDLGPLLRRAAERISAGE